MIAKLIEQLLKELGEDAQREGLERTPDRVEKALRYLTSGYGKDYNYNATLRFREPPYFINPTESAWRVVRQNEQVPAR